MLGGGYGGAGGGGNGGEVFLVKMGSLKSLGERRLKKVVFVIGNGGGDGGE